jgi:N6-L-threonylcarbamoyladenine synthase
LALAFDDGFLQVRRILEVKKGECGLRQSGALFLHTVNLPELFEELFRKYRERFGKDAKIDAVAYSAYPRDTEGSYMPCFLAGKVAAASFAAARDLPLFEFSHQNGHVMAALYSSGREELMGGRFLAFHVSGGTTEALLCEPRPVGFSIRLVGETADINAGQAIDRVGVAMGLAFPCGRELERLAAAYDGRPYRHPVCVREGRCSLSGVENIALRLLSEGHPKEEVAAFVFDFIGRTLTEMGEQILRSEGQMPVLFAGGVMSNRLMRAGLSAHFDAAFSEPEFSADNAAGIALLCRRRARLEEET